MLRQTWSKRQKILEYNEMRLRLLGKRLIYLCVYNNIYLQIIAKSGVKTKYLRTGTQILIRRHDDDIRTLYPL